MDPLLTIGAVIIAEIVLFGGAILLLSGGDGTRWGTAVRAFGRALRDRAFADKVQPLLAPPPAETLAPPKPSGAPLRLLALLQRDGRLLDFLLEDIQTYSNEQIGAAVRDIHRHCHAALQEHLVLEPVLPQEEGSAVEVPAGFDPSAIRLTGNLTGHPPFRGTLQHHGWRVKELKLNPPAEGVDEFVLMPAEVELP